MTPTRFTIKRMLGQISPNSEVRVLVFRFNNSPHEWEELYVDEYGETIADQEARFRAAMRPFCKFITPLTSGTIKAKHWRAL
jgi:hypothetical protein